MTIRHAIWRVAATPEPLQAASLTSEAHLEDMIVAAPSILHEEWMLIGRQIDTGFGGRLDLLAIAPDGALVLIELKRDRTPRDVIAQAIDYATFRPRKSPRSTPASSRTATWAPTFRPASANRWMRTH